MSEKKKILLVTPKFPWPMTGACETDRAEGIKQLLRFGFDVRLIVKDLNPNKPIISQISKELGIDIFPISYKYHQQSKIFKYLKIFLTKPTLLDGAAYEFSDPELVGVFKRQIKDWQPDLVWLDYTFTWPLAKIAKAANLKVVTNSQNYEPEHFLQEEGGGLLNRLMYKAKVFTEQQSVKYSDILFAITPHDQKLYEDLGARNIALMPLRSLPSKIRAYREIKAKEKLNVFFAGSTYNVSHNRQALKMVIKDIVPQVNKLFPDKFIFNILGNKFPEDFKKYLNKDIKYLGFVEDLDKTMEEMDISLTPSLSGGGMQQKIFEPMARGIPTVTSSRGLAGYPFKDQEHVLLADSVDDFVDALGKMQNVDLRKKLSFNSIKLSKELFSQSKIDDIVSSNINSLL